VEAWYGLANMGGKAMVNLKTGKSDRIKGKDVWFSGISRSAKLR
jgi:hypothetical protein